MAREMPAWLIGTALLLPLVGFSVLASTSPDHLASYATLLSTFYAALSGVSAWLAVKAANEERRERSRPVVQPDCPISSSSEVFFRLTNTGGSAAENITLTFDPSPVDFNGKPLSANSLFQSAIPLLTPGQEIKHFFQMGFNFSKPDVPAVFNVRVEYRGKGVEYAETRRIDLSIYRDMTLPRPTAQESLAAISKSLVEIRADVMKMAAKT